MMMENNSGVIKGDGHGMELLPLGFRFHPTDEELITHYLSKKVLDCNFSPIAIGEADMNKGEQKWVKRNGIFSVLRDKKYPTGLRTNRATASGYWKATGKDKEIFRGGNTGGDEKDELQKVKKPIGSIMNTDWREISLLITSQMYLRLINATVCLCLMDFVNDWVISRVFQKTSGGKRVDLLGLLRINSVGKELANATLPPLMDPSPYTGPSESELGNVNCFSNTILAPQKSQQDLSTFLNNPILPSSSNPPDDLQFPPINGFPFSGSVSLQDPSILRSFFFPVMERT